MSYHEVSQTPRLEPRPLRGASGLGALLDANVNTKAYYICLVEVWDNKLGLRSYQWTPYKYLSNWDALGFSLGFEKTLPGGRQTAIMYQWVTNSLTGQGSWVRVAG